MAYARDQMGGKEHVVAICGDAAFTCGVTFEALNNITSATRRLIVILNDNEWSIDKNVGAIAQHLNRLITNPIYNRINDAGSQILNHIPGGESIRRLGQKAKKETKDFLVASSVFENFGLRYVGPIDGHNLKTLIEYLEFAKTQEMPVLLHVLTQKGKGCNVALDEPEKFHGTSPFDVETGLGRSSSVGTPITYQDTFRKGTGASCPARIAGSWVSLGPCQAEQASLTCGMNFAINISMWASPRSMRFSLLPAQLPVG
jgi:1-deoxy-D-xylulose-5-phosphate synthase